MDFHVLTPTGQWYICSLIDGKCVIDPSPAQQPETSEPTPLAVESSSLRHTKTTDETFPSG